MEKTIIVCPHCQEEIDLSEAMNAALQTELAQKSQQLEQDSRQRNDQLLQEKEAELRRRLEQQKQIELEAAIATAKAKEEENARALAALQQEREQERAQRENELAEQKKQIELAQQEAERVRLEAREESARKQRELEEREAQLRTEAETQKREADRILAEERAAMAEKLQREMNTAQLLKDAENNQTIASLTRQIEELKVAAKSQQLTGEAQEIALEEVLRMAFPDDIVEPVGKGMKGADCFLRVRHAGEIVGSIIFESKRTKDWSGLWCDKLKDDQRSAPAEIAVLVTQAFPADVKNRTAYYEGVWLTDFPSAIGMVMALRAGLIEVMRTKKLMETGTGKDAEVLAFITSTEFRQSIQAIAETFLSFQEELAAEKRSMERTWKKREVTIKRALTATLKVHSSLQAILGAGAIPNIDETSYKQLTT